MRSADEIAAEIEGLSIDELRRRVLRQDGYIENLERRIGTAREALGMAPDEAAAALRARPDRAEVERVIRQYWSEARSSAFAPDAKERRNASLMKALRDLGYGEPG